MSPDSTLLKYAGNRVTNETLCFLGATDGGQSGGGDRFFTLLSKYPSTVQQDWAMSDNSICHGVDRTIGIFQGKDA